MTGILTAANQSKKVIIRIVGTRLFLYLMVSNIDLVKDRFTSVKKIFEKINVVKVNVRTVFSSEFILAKY